MARLVIFDDAVRGLELPNRPVLIGRSKKNDIPIRDGLLSRKHCSIVPMGAGYRLMDLKSSNGTYLNGRRIEKIDLTVDDIIEIGRTVMVFLEDGVWSRGEGLARLRNPLKAQELIARIKRAHRAPGKRDIPLDAPLPERPLPGRPGRPLPGRIAGGGRRATGTGAERPARRGGRGSARRKAPPAVDPSIFADFPKLLEDFVTHRAVRLLLSGSPAIRRLVAEALNDALAGASPGQFPGTAAGDDTPRATFPELRARVRAALSARLGRPADSTAEGPSPGSPSPGGPSPGAASPGGPAPEGENDRTR